MTRAMHSLLRNLRTQLRAAAPEAFAEAQGPPVTLPPLKVFRALPPDAGTALSRSDRGRSASPEPVRRPARAGGPGVRFPHTRRTRPAQPAAPHTAAREGNACVFAGGSPARPAAGPGTPFAKGGASGVP
jgi:hypothetical protein